MIDEHDFGFISDGIKYYTLTGAYTPSTTGLYNLHIENTSSYAASTCIFSYLDNISVIPFLPGPNLSTDTTNVYCLTGGTINFDLNAGSGNADTPYWIWMSMSGTYPGMLLSGIEVPLNYDLLLEFGLMYPGFPGSSGFLGTLDGSGTATASIQMPTDPQQNMMNICFNFAFVVLSPGYTMPIQFASYPVHVKYIP